MMLGGTLGTISNGAQCPGGTHINGVLQGT
jgi:hypothetical protein